MMLARDLRRKLTSSVQRGDVSPPKQALTHYTSRERHYANPNGVPGRDEERAIVRAMHGVKRCGKRTSYDSGNRPREAWLGGCSIRQRKQKRGEGRNGQQHN